MVDRDAGFVGFVGNLQRPHLRQQFALFCWVHISLLLIVVSRQAFRLISYPV